MRRHNPQTPIPRARLARLLVLPSICVWLVATPLVAQVTPQCEWTDWLNRDSPGGSGDFESLGAFVEAGQVCARPQQVECRTIEGEDWSTTGQSYTCTIDLGGICVHSDQPRGEQCHDYEARFCCGAENVFRTASELRAPFVERARAGRQTAPFERKELLRWANAWPSRVNEQGEYESYPRALFEFATEAQESATTSEPGETRAEDVDSDPVGPGVAELATCDRCTVQGRWIYRGPDRLKTQNQGVVRSVWVAPGDPEHIRIGSASGLWETRDDGATWENLTDSSKHLGLVGVIDIAVHPTNPQDLFVATALTVGFSDVDRSYGFGVFRSRNGGSTWNPVGLADISTKGFPVSHRVLFHPLDPQVLYASLGPEVYKSVDGGATWSLLFEASVSADESLTIRDIEVRPLQGTDEVFVTTSSALKEYVISNPAGCVASTPWTYVWANSGLTYCEIRHTARVWKLTTPRLQTSLSSSPTDLSPTITDYQSSTTLAAAEVTAQGVIIAAHSGLHGASGVPRVELYFENGGNWLRTTPILGDDLNYGYTLQLEVSQADPQVMYLTGVLLMKSIDGGQSFSTMGQQYWDFLGLPKWAGSHPDVRAIFFRGQGPSGDVVYFGTDGGVSRTRDGLSSTENLNGAGLQLAEVHGVGISESRPGLVVFGTQHNGFFTNREYVWQLDPFGDFYESAIAETPNGQITALTSSNNSTDILKYHDATTASSSESCPEASCSDTEVVVGATHIYLGGRSLSRQKLGDTTWTAVASLPGCRVSGLAPSQDESLLYVGCAGPLWSGQDPGTFTERAYLVSSPAGPTPTFQDITSGLSGVAWRGITDVATNPEGSTVYVPLGGFGQGVFRRNRGESWSRIDAGLPEVPVNALAYDRDSDTLFAGTDVGVYVKPPNSETWMDTTGSAPLTLVSDLEIDHRRRTLVASTYGRGVWEACLPTAGELKAYCRPVSVVDDPIDAPD